jgi:hypothetical protein
MEHRIELRGPARYGAVGLVLLVAICAWLAPSLVSGFVEQHKTNLTGHWITTAKGNYRSMPFIAIAGETVSLDHSVEVRDGSVVIRVRRYILDIVPEFTWAEQIRDSAAGHSAMSVAVTGIYRIELSYIGFDGSVALDWEAG